MKKEKDIEELRQDYQKQYDYYCHVIEDYVSKYKNTDSEYIQHKRALMFYNRGALTAINKIMEV